MKFVPRIMYPLHDAKEYNFIFVLFEGSVWAHWPPISFLLQCMDSKVTYPYVNAKGIGKERESIIFVVAVVI